MPNGKPKEPIYDILKKYIIEFRPKKFEKNVNKAIVNYSIRKSVLKSADTKFKTNQIISLSTDISQVSNANSVKQTLKLPELKFKDVVNLAESRGGLVVVNSSSGLESTRKKAGKTFNHSFVSCNCGAYIEEVNDDGTRTVIKNNKIPKSAVTTILDVLNSEKNVISISDLNNTYTTERIVDKPSSTNVLQKIINFYTSIKFKNYAQKSLKALKYNPEPNDEGFLMAMDSAYGITVTPVVDNPNAFKNVNIESGLQKGLLFPVIKHNSDKDKENLLFTSQINSMVETVLTLANQPEAIRKKYENEIDILITSNGIRIVPKGCNKISSIQTIQAGMGIDKEKVSLLGGASEDFIKSVSLEDVRNVKASDAKGFLSGLIKTPQQYTSTQQITSFIPSQKSGLNNFILSLALQNMANNCNALNLNKLKDDAHSQADDFIKNEVNNLMAIYDSNHPGIDEKTRKEQQSKIEARVKSEVESKLKNISLSDKDKVQQHHFYVQSPVQIFKKFDMVDNTKISPTPLPSTVTPKKSEYQEWLEKLKKEVKARKGRDAPVA